MPAVATTTLFERFGGKGSHQRGRGVAAPLIREVLQLIGGLEAEIVGSGTEKTTSRKAKR